MCHIFMITIGKPTGSQDFAVHDLFVPTAYTFNAADNAPLHPGPLYRLPVIITLGSTLGPLALGIARGALDSFVELMATKVDRFTGTALRERLTVQERVAKAEAAMRTARAFLYEMVHEVWDTVEQGAPLTEQQLALFRLANMHAVAAGAQAVDLGSQEHPADNGTCCIIRLIAHPGLCNAARDWSP
jgi:alkylation response protein AidB-like acyl-CoA dehydrogenase